MQANQNNSRPRLSRKKAAFVVVSRTDKLFEEKNANKAPPLLCIENNGRIHKYKKSKNQLTDEELMDENGHGNIL